MTKREFSPSRWLLVLPIAAISLFVIFPIATIVLQFARFENIWQALTTPSLHKVWWFSFWQALLSTATTLIVGLPTTWALSRFRFTGDRIIAGVLTVPFLMPAVVIAAGIRAVIPSGGMTAIVWAHVAFNVAVVLRVVGPRWTLLDQIQIDTAADLGARPFRIASSVVWPHIKSAVLNSASLVFVFCFTSFAIVAVLGGIRRRTIEGEIFIQAIRLGDMQTATALAILQALVIIGVVLTTSRYRQQDAMTLTSPSAPRARMSWGIFASIALPVAVVVTPLIFLIRRSFIINGDVSSDGYKWLFDGTTDSVGIEAVLVIRTSLIFAFFCAAIAIPLALIISTSLSTHNDNEQNHTDLWPRITSLLTTAPMVLSSVTMGLGLIIAFDEWPIEWRSQQWLIPVIHAVIALPLATFVLVPAAQAIPHDLRRAAASLGAGPLRAWAQVDLRLLMPAIRRASGLCAAVSLGEFGATSFLSRSGSTTIPIAISQLINRPGDVLPQTAFALATVTVVICALLLSPR